MLKLKIVDRNALDQYTDLPVGEVLRRARVQYELEIPHVSSRLNIRPEHIAAIEAGDVVRLPGRVYAIGFVRTYATYLQLDADKIVYLFKAQCIGHTHTKNLSFPTPIKETRSPAAWMIAASLGTITIITALFLFIKTPDKTIEPTPEMPEAVAEISSNITPSTTGKLTIKALETSWVQIQSGDAADTDPPVFSRVLNKGETYTAPDIENMRLSTGNAEGIEVLWDGQVIDIFEGRKGAVNDLPVGGLNAYKFKAQQP
jgi:hypothetical protein